MFSAREGGAKTVLGVQMRPGYPKSIRSLNLLLSDSVVLSYPIGAS